MSTPSDDRLSQIEQLINKRFDAIELSNAQINNTLRSRKFVISDLARENRDLRKHVLTLEERLLKLEKQVNNTEQNNRKNNIEVDGIPSSVSDEDLRGVVATLFNHIVDSDITIADIEVAHRLHSKSSPKPTIVRLKRDVIQELKTKEARGKLKDVATKMNFPRGTQIFLNDNQSPNMRSLSYNARLLKNRKIIYDTWFSNAAVRIKRTPSSRPIKITHEKDLVDEFPEFEDFTFDMEFYHRLKDEEDINQYDELRGYDEEEDDSFRRTDDSKSKTSNAPTVSDINAYINKISKFGPPGASHGGIPHGAASTSSWSDENTGASGAGLVNERESNGAVDSDGVLTGSRSAENNSVTTVLDKGDDEKETDRGENGVETTVSPLCPPKTPSADDLNLKIDPPLTPTGNGLQRSQIKTPLNPHLTRSTTRNLGLFN